VLAQAGYCLRMLADREHHLAEQAKVRFERFSTLWSGLEQPGHDLNCSKRPELL
jgi:hypothetical protein